MEAACLDLITRSGEDKVLPINFRDSQPMDQRATSLLGVNISDIHGNEIGNVADLLVVMDDRQMDVIWLEIDDLLEQNSKFYVPLKDITESQGAFRLLKEQSLLKISPSGSKFSQISIRNLLQTYVEDEEGDRIGGIMDFVLDLESGEVRYVVIEVESAIFTGRHVVAPDWIFVYDRGEQGLESTLDGELITAAPEFDPAVYRLNPDWDWPVVRYYDNLVLNQPRNAAR